MSVSDVSLETVGLLQDLDNLITNFKTAQQAYATKLSQRDISGANTQRDNMTQLASNIVTLTALIKPRLSDSDTKTASYINLASGTDASLSKSVDDVAQEFKKIQAKMTEENQFIGKDETSGLVVKSAAYKYVTYVVLTAVMVFLAFVSITSQEGGTGPLLALFLLGMGFIIYQYWFSVTTTVSLAAESWVDKIDMQIRWLLQSV
jgi:hypothetical protein